MRVLVLCCAVFVVLGACAGPSIAVPDGERLSETLRADYRDAVAAWIEGDHVAARRRLADLEQLEPWFVPAHVLRQDAWTALEGPDAVRAWYEAEAERAPDDAARVLLLGRLTPRDDGLREAAYRRARELDPESPWPSLALSLELNRAALETYRRSVAAADLGYREQAAELEERAAALHTEARAVSDAVLAAYPEVAEVQSVAAELLLTRGVALGERSTLLRALEHAETAATLDPAHPARHALLARIHRALIDDPAAEEDLRRALDLDPADPDLLAGLGRVLLDLGRPEEAREVLRDALRRLPDDAVVMTDLGVAAQRMGDLDAAVARLGAAAAIAPSDARPLQALALVHIERGDRPAARRALRSYLARGGDEREWAESVLAELGADPERRADEDGAP